MAGMNNDTGRTVHEIDLGKVMTITDTSGTITPLLRVEIKNGRLNGQFNLTFIGQKLIVDRGVIVEDAGEVVISEVPLRWSATGN